MKWFDKDIKYYRSNGNLNPFTDNYYGYLLKIKKAQEYKTISDELFTSFSRFKYGLESPEWGYYTSNIHYDIYNEFESVPTIEKRIIDFLDKADKTVLKNEAWFYEQSFVYDLRSLVIRRYGGIKNIPFGITNDELVRKYGNEIEKEIYKAWKKIR